ncbi:MAG: radical SAM family heme chaperone HemW [Ferruginibacter sp.]
MAGIYIHIPFCRQACSYCNFHFSTSLALKDEFIASLIKEIALTESITNTDETIDTIYFGGGTPSLLNSNELASLFEALQKKFNINKNAEITLEANPDDINRIILNEWMNIGINRLSLGVQSFKEEELKWMNRAHNAKESLKSIDEIPDAGFNNFSVDLIFGSPLLSNEELEKNLQIIFDKNVPHISCYALTVEPKTVLNKLIEQKKSLPVNSEKQAAQFLLLMDAMKQHGYEHYEISNFAKPGMRSKHNSSYWQGKPYYGFGPSAHSFNGINTRRWNIANNALYIQSIKNNEIPFEEEVLTDTQRLNEYIMTALRTAEGINTEKVSLEFGIECLKKLKTSIKKYIDSNKVIIQNTNLVLTNEGKLFADGIAADLFF